MGSSIVNNIILVLGIPNTCLYKATHNIVVQYRAIGQYIKVTGSVCVCTEEPR